MTTYHDLVIESQHCPFLRRAVKEVRLCNASREDALMNVAFSLSVSLRETQDLLKDRLMRQAMPMPMMFMNKDDPQAVMLDTGMRINGLNSELDYSRHENAKQAEEIKRLNKCCDELIEENKGLRGE